MKYDEFLFVNENVQSTTVFILFNTIVAFIWLNINTHKTRSS